MHDPVAYAPSPLRTDPHCSAIRRIQAAAAARGKVCGIWCSTAEMARDMAAQGHHLVVPGHDALWLKAEMSRRLATVRA